MPQSITHQLAAALRFIERTCDRWARRLEPGVYRVWHVRPPTGADPLSTTVITVRGRGDGTWIIASGTARAEPPAFIASETITPAPDH